MVAHCNINWLIFTSYWNPQSFYSGPLGTTTTRGSTGTTTTSNTLENTTYPRCVGFRFQLCPTALWGSICPPRGLTSNSLTNYPGLTSARIPMVRRPWLTESFPSSLYQTIGAYMLVYV